MPAIRSRSFSSGDTVVVPEKASIVGEGILTFTGYLSEVNRSDAQNAYLFASLVANKKYPREDQGQDWYLLFRDVMNKAGWSSTSIYYNNLEVGGYQCPYGQTGTENSGFGYLGSGIARSD